MGALLVYKPIYIWGAPSCRIFYYKLILIFHSKPSILGYSIPSNPNFFRGFDRPKIATRAARPCSWPRAATALKLPMSWSRWLWIGIFGRFYRDLIEIECWCHLVGGLVAMNFTFPYIGNNHPNWLIFFRGVDTTNQSWIFSNCFMELWWFHGCFWDLCGNAGDLMAIFVDFRDLMTILEMFWWRFRFLNDARVIWWGMLLGF